ncbi:MFS transporter [Pontibacillus litoralis]|uniref:MFS transporter n=1 Tax=Pontibacillus litoralis JSM 072002 TaxID=1385512 RepID=A0A0A5HTH2_9BACI|nr:MFS transporter [Pontibacillus litoralis]KGX86922.1 MFS transporter [Pontibacillus litoralis JSM 072002]
MRKLKQTLAVFRNRTYTKIFLAAVTSRIGSIVGITAFMFYLLDRFSTQPVYATLTEMMYSAPTLLVFVFTGFAADRLDRQKVAYYADLICGGLSIVLLLSIWTEWMPLIFATLFLRSSVSKFFAPAEMSIVQGVLTEEEYTAAAGLNQMIAGVFSLFATGLGLGVYWLVGISGAIIMDGISFFLSAALIASCAIPEHVRQPNGKFFMKDIHYRAIIIDFSAGLRYIFNHSLLKALIGGFFIFGIVNGAFTVIPIYMLKYNLAPETYEQWSVIVGIVFGSCMIVGSILSPMIIHKIRIHISVSCGLIIAGFIVIACGFSQHIAFYILMMALLGLSLPLTNIAIGGWLPAIVDKKMMGRVESWIIPISMLSQTATLGIISIGFPSFFSISSLYFLCGVILLIVGICYTILLPKLSKKHTNSLHVQEA